MAREQSTPVITDVAPSREQQRRSRTQKYLIMMSIRVVAVVSCGILVIVEAPYLWMWLSVGIFATTVIPWLAVMLANDRPAKKERRMFYRPPPTEKPGPTQLADQENRRYTIDPD